MQLFPNILIITSIVKLCCRRERCSDEGEQDGDTPKIKGHQRPPKFCPSSVPSPLWCAAGASFPQILLIINYYYY